MKKLFYILIVTMLSSTMDLCAQSDGFFMKYNEKREEINDEWGQMLMLPDEHNVNYNYPADDVSLGNEVLMVLGMGVVYAGCRRKR